MEKNEIIHLGIYGDTSYEILKALRNTFVSGHAEFYSRTTALSRNYFSPISIDRWTDNEIVFKATKYISMNPKDFMSQLAIMLKGLAKLASLSPAHYISTIPMASITKCESWKRTNDSTVKIDGWEFRMSDIYAVYEILKGRAVKWHKFNDAAGIKDRIIGQAFDPVRTEIEIAYREQLNMIKTEFESKEQAVEKNYTYEYNEIYQKREHALEVIRDERLKAEAKLKAEYSEVRGISEPCSIQAA